MKKKTYSPEYIEKLRVAYLIEKKSTTEMSKDSVSIFGISMSPATIYNDLVRNNIPLRDKSESVSMAVGELDKSKNFLTENIIEWIDGLMLGDGSIGFKKPDYKGSRFRIGSSSKEWTSYGISGLSPYSPREPIVYGKISDRCPNQTWLSQTLMHPDITLQAKRWYSGFNQTKKIPEDVRITATSIMLWYLGDGSFHYEKDGNMSMLRLATCAFEKNDLEQIIIPKLQKYNIDCYVDNYKNDIHIRSDSIKSFFEIIGYKSPISCYDYKFDIPEWLKLIRLSDIVANVQERWRALSWYKSGKLECSKSPGGRMLLFTRDQAEKLKKKLISP